MANTISSDARSDASNIGMVILLMLMLALFGLLVFTLQRPKVGTTDSYSPPAPMAEPITAPSATPGGAPRAPIAPPSP